MKQFLTSICLMSLLSGAIAQTNPAISSWLINTNGTTGRHYVSGNSTPINDTIQVNVQTVRYSSNNSYVNASGIPSYIIGPYLDGNPSQGTHNAHLFQFPLSPSKNTGTKTGTPLGVMGVFINGVPMYNPLDAMSYNNQGVWNRDAIVNEMNGFDCAKGHPSPIFQGGPPPGGTLVGGTYHHHQNPTAFNLDLQVVSNVCNLYLADGLYQIDSTQHSPLIGFAFDGYPVYGAYAYSDTVGGGGIRRMESSYRKRSITVRTHYANGQDVTDGPAVNTTYPLGTYVEDYEYVQGFGDLDEHNGRFCVTPEYPQGTYAYFATVDQNWNSAYPYIIGPQYYGNVTGGEIATITEQVQTYTDVPEQTLSNLNLTVFPNPAGDLLAVQMGTLINKDYEVALYGIDGKLVLNTVLRQGSTIAYLDTRTVYPGSYVLTITDGKDVITRKVMISR